jgi:hypothetical protein
MAQGALLEQLGVLVTKPNMMMPGVSPELRCGSTANCDFGIAQKLQREPLHLYQSGEQQPPPWLGGVHPALPKPTEGGAAAGEVGDAEWGDFYMRTIP